jgi:hypothetical protein
MRSLEQVYADYYRRNFHVNGIKHLLVQFWIEALPDNSLESIKAFLAKRVDATVWHGEVFSSLTQLLRAPQIAKSLREYEPEDRLLQVHHGILDLGQRPENFVILAAIVIWLADDSDQEKAIRTVLSGMSMLQNPTFGLQVGYLLTELSA